MYKETKEELNIVMYIFCCITGDVRS
jgi:hypothetical protein